jgi:hypothetical protein
MATRRSRCLRADPAGGDECLSRNAIVATVTSVSKVCLRKMLESDAENAGAATMHHCETRRRGGGNLVQPGLASSAAAQLLEADEIVP